MSVRYGLRKFKGVGLASCVIGLYLLGAMGYSTVVNADDTVSSIDTTVESTPESTDSSVSGELSSVNTDNSDKSTVLDENTGVSEPEIDDSSDRSSLESDKPTDSSLVSEYSIEKTEDIPMNENNNELNTVSTELKPLMLNVTSDATNRLSVSENSTDVSKDVSSYNMFSFEGGGLLVNRVYNSDDDSYSIEFKGDWIDDGDNNNKLGNNYFKLPTDNIGAFVRATVKNGELMLEGDSLFQDASDGTVLVDLNNTSNLDKISWQENAKIMHTNVLVTGIFPEFIDFKNSYQPTLFDYYPNRNINSSIVVNIRKGSTQDGTLFTRLDFFYIHGFYSGKLIKDTLKSIAVDLAIPPSKIGLDYTYDGNLTYFSYDKYSVITQDNNLSLKKYLILEDGTYYKPNYTVNQWYRDGRLLTSDMQEVYRFSQQGNPLGYYSSNGITLSSPSGNSMSFISKLSNDRIGLRYEALNEYSYQEDGIKYADYRTTNSYKLNKWNTHFLSGSNVVTYPFDLGNGFSNILDVDKIGSRDLSLLEKYGFIMYNYKPFFISSHGYRFLTYKNLVQKFYTARIDFCTENGTVGHQDFIDTDYNRVITVSDLKIPDGYRLLLRDKGNATYPNEIGTIGRISRSGGFCVLLVEIPKEPEYPSEPSNPTEPSEPTKPEEEPNNPTDEPNTPTEEHNVPNEEPEVPSEEPTKPEEEPAKPEEEPSKPSEESDKPNKEPNEPTEEPDEPTDLPNNPNEDIEVPKEDTEFPNEPSKEPNVDSNIPNEKINLPNTGKDVPIEKVVSKNPTKSVEIIDNSSNAPELPKTNYESNKSLTVLGGLTVSILGVLGLEKVVRKLRKNQN